MTPSFPRYISHSTLPTTRPPLDMISIPHSNRGRSALLTLALLLTVATTILNFKDGATERFDACFIRRESQRPPAPLIPLRDSVLHDASVYVMWVSMLLLCMLPNGRQAAFESLTFSSIWFHTTYIFLAAAKAPLQDYNCAGRHIHFPNAISGHYCYFIFVILTAAQFTRLRLAANPNPSPLILLVVLTLLCAFVIGAVATLYRTFFHGYHSLRQIFLGTSLGLFSHVLLDIVHLDASTGFSTFSQIVLLLSNSLTTIALYLQLWPHQKAGPAIGPYQFLFHASLWTILLASSSRLLFRKKQATE